MNDHTFLECFECWGWKCQRCGTMISRAAMFAFMKPKPQPDGTILVRPESANNPNSFARVHHIECKEPHDE